MALVVVGVDGSTASRQALQAAADEASLRDARLAMVSVWDVGVFDYLGHDALGETSRTEGILAEAIAQVHERHPDVPCSAETRRGQPSEELLRAAVGADLLVVGSRGLGGFRGLLLGSVSDQVAQHATCPVLFVHAQREPKHPHSRPGFVVVGVDGSAASEHALDFAITEAALRRTALHVVCAWPPVDAFLGPPLPTLPGEVDDVHATEEKRLRRSRARAIVERARAHCEAASLADVKERVVEGDAISVLIDASEPAEMLVVGSRGRGSFAGTLLGSVSRGCAHHARCPVAIVHRRP